MNIATRSMMTSPPSSPIRQLEFVFVQINVMIPTRKMYTMFCICIALGFTLLFISALTVPNFDSVNIKPRRWKARIHIEHEVFEQLIHQDVWDYRRLIDGIVHKPQCSKPLLHIIITSATSHRSQRDTIRQTWCSQSNLIQPYLPAQTTNNVLLQCSFLIGSSTDRTVMQNIQQEITSNNDILLGDYIDTYRNLSLKVLTGLHWASTECMTPYVLKTDDDCFVNTNILIRLLAELPKETSDSALYVGNSLSTLEHTVVIRKPESKWAVSFEEYAPDYYPSYISGTGYLLSKFSLDKIVAQSKLHVPFPVEDAYIGVLAEQAGILPEQSFRFTLIREKWRTCNFAYLLLIHNINESMQYEFQNQVTLAYGKCPVDKVITRW